MFMMIAKMIAKPLFDWLGHKQEMSMLKRQTMMTIELKKQELVNTQATADINWDKTMAKASATSWKDEFWTVLLAFPVILVFFPSMAEYVSNGFVVLERDVPQWYKVALGVAISAAFGRQELIKWFTNVKS